MHTGRRRTLRLLFLAVAPVGALLASFAGCTSGASAERTCNVDADCASGRCLPSGACVMPEGDGASGAASGDAAQQNETGASTTMDGGLDARGDGPSGACEFGAGDAIGIAQVPMAPNLVASFVVSKAVKPFSSLCADAGAGGCGWDLVGIGGAAASTASVLTQTEAISGKWYEKNGDGGASFPGATYVAKLSDFVLDGLPGSGFHCAQAQWGIFRADTDALVLLGIVSETEDGGGTYAGVAMKTKLVYDTPVPILKFPLKPGATWSVTSTTAHGQLCGSLGDYPLTQDFTSKVDGEGTLETPYGHFKKVLRVSTLMHRHGTTLSVTPVSETWLRSFSFVSPCHGIVASMAGNDGVKDDELTEAAEVRALGNLPK